VTHLTRPLSLRPGEGRLVGLVAAVFASIEIARGFGEIAADSLVIGRFGSGSLPWLFIGLGIASLVAALAFGAVLGRLRRGHLVVSVLVALAAGLAIEQLALVAGLPIVPLLWVSVYATGALATTLAWTLAGSVLDTRQAKRLFPVCTSAAIGGSFVGTLGAGPAAALVGTEWVVALEAIGLAVAAGFVSRLASGAEGGRLRVRPPRRPVVTEFRAGFDFVLHSPLMRLVAVAYVLFSVLMFSVTSPFFRALAEAFPPGASAELTAALGLLSAVVTGTSFVISLVVAPRLYARFGLATAAVLLPIVYAAGFGLWIVAFSPATAALVRYAQQVTQRGLSNAAWSAFYNVVPAARRAQVLAFNDGVPGQLGIVLSGVLLLTVEAVLTPEQIPWLGATTAVACIAVVIAIRRRYAEALLQALRSGLGERVLEGGPGIVSLGADGRTTIALIDALDDPQPAVRSMVAELLGRLRVTGAAQALTRRAADSDPRVRAAVIVALASIGEGAAAGRIEPGLIDPDATVRAAAIDAAARTVPDAVVRHVDRLAADPHPAVRASLAVALSEMGRPDDATALMASLLSAAASGDRVAGLRALGRIEAIDPPLDDGPDFAAAALADEATPVRRAAAAVIQARPVVPDSVIALLAGGSPETSEAVLWALDGHAAQARGAVLTWARGRVARATDLQRRVRALDGAPAGDGALAFLAAILARRQREILHRLLTGLAVLDAPEAAGLIRRSLGSDDADVRAQAIEAIDSIGDAELRRAIVSLLERPTGDARPNEDGVLGDLTSDPDQWIRVIALRARAERNAEESTIREQARIGPDPIVRDALIGFEEGGLLRMPDATHILGEIDRMLFLRRVPLFAELAPEDLQRLAMTCVERLYGADEVVVSEGEIGSELVLIVEGSVRVVHVEAEGTERLLRRYDAGDHFGELAVLREAPRAATVIAEPPGIRGLVIGGEGLTAILRERPDAAMAMLATLATRISQG